MARAQRATRFSGRSSSVMLRSALMLLAQRFAVERMQSVCTAS